MKTRQPLSVVDRETFLRAILHGWESCFVDAHLDVDKAWRRLTTDCFDESCDCQDLEAAAWLLGEVDDE